jgi:hypothetical protein
MDSASDRSPSGAGIAIHVLTLTAPIEGFQYAHPAQELSDAMPAGGIQKSRSHGNAVE